MAGLYHETTGRTQESIQNVNGCLFIITCELIFTVCYSVMTFYPSQMPILRRETNEHIYNFSAYYIAEVFNVLPVCFLRSFAGIAITYTWAGFNNGYALFFRIGLTLFIASFTSNAYGLLMSGILKTTIPDLASISDLVFLCFSGLYMNLNSVRFIRYISPFYYANEALAISFWSNVTHIGLFNE